jgi:thiol-disulfide isomerase/thioredoxin
LAGGAVLCGAALAVGLGALFYAGDTPEEHAAPTPAVAGEVFPAAAPKPVPELRFVDDAGRPRSLTDFRGKAVLLNLWATWCAPCRKEMPALDRLQARLGGSGFQVVPLSIDKKGLPAVQAFYKELGLTSLAVYVDVSGSSANEVGAPGLPTTLLLDARGLELGRVLGPKEWDAEAVVAEIEQRIGRAPTPGAAAAEP